MRVYDLIYKKRQGEELTKEELDYLIKGYTKGDIPDYQMSAFLMATYYRGMTDSELAYFTNAMCQSGDQMNLSGIQGIKVDKHSTGGVGDKTTLVVAPIVAACGVKVAKMSGRGLGHTGGTIDKLESIPGFQTNLSNQQFFEIVNRVGACIVGQTGNLAPADKKIYALRDTTATVDSIPLIASSIMSKKLAAGSDGILLDVKVGSGAFMKSIDDAKLLAHKMIAIGRHHNRKMCAIITDMDVPLGYFIGNSLEVMEAVDVLQCRGPEDLMLVCVELATYMLYLAQIGTIENCRKRVLEALHSGNAYGKFVEMVEAQGGDCSYITGKMQFQMAKYHYELISEREGFLTNLNSECCGEASVLLGAGRENKDSLVDYTAGIRLHKKTGDYVKQGDCIATLYANNNELFKEAAIKMQSGLQWGNEKPAARPLILEYIL